MSVVQCPHCKVVMEIPDTFTEGDKAIALKTFRTSGFRHTMGWLMQRHHLRSRNVMRIVRHLPFKEGICVHCHRELLDEGNTICPVCNALNFNW